MPLSFAIDYIMSVFLEELVLVCKSARSSARIPISLLLSQTDAAPPLYNALLPENAYWHCKCCRHKQPPADAIETCGIRATS
jgi:hypothetical protein